MRPRTEYSHGFDYWECRLLYPGVIPETDERGEADYRPPGIFAKFYFLSVRVEGNKTFGVFLNDAGAFAGIFFLGKQAPDIMIIPAASQIFVKVFISQLFPDLYMLPLLFPLIPGRVFYEQTWHNWTIYTNPFCPEKATPVSSSHLSEVRRLHRCD